jgi:PAS domain S-box-containing protein
MIGWFVFISLDLILFPIATLSFSNAIPGTQYSGYNMEYPSLLMANILRDVSTIGTMLVIGSFFFTALNLRFGNEVVRKILSNKLIILIIFISFKLLIYGDRLIISITNEYVVVDSDMQGFSAIAFALGLLLYLIAVIIITFQFKDLKVYIVSNRSKKQLKSLIYALFLHILGFFIFLLMGLIQNLIPLIFQQYHLRFIFQIGGHSVWILSGLILGFSLKFPFEHLGQSNRDFLNIGKSLYYSANDLFIQTELSGKIITINQFCKNILGYHPNELIGKNFKEIIKPEFFLNFEEYQKSLQSQSNQNQPLEIEVLHKNRTPILLEIQSNIIDQITDNSEGEKCLIIQTIGRDITSRRELEKKMFHTQKLESIALLAGGIAHDFNNILVPIFGNISLLKLHEFQSDIKPEIEESLKDLERAAFHAQELTKQLLTFTKGGIPVKNPVSIVKFIERSVRFALHGSNCDWTFYNETRINPIINIDENQIQRVLTNIVINATHAMSSGGTVEVTLKQVKLDSKYSLPLPNGNYICIEITDHGKGITKDLQNRIFEPYFSTKPSGSGLGLAISYSIIQKHNGYITFESEPGNTTFIIYLPYEEMSKMDEVVVEPSVGIFSGRILIMDDNIHVRRILRQLLEKLKIEVDEADSGEVTIAKVKSSLENSKNPYNAVILDLTIPGKMGGIETMDKIRTLAPNIRRILSTGFLSDELLKDYPKHNFDAILNKPFTIKQLKEILTKIDLSN